MMSRQFNAVPWVGAALRKSVGRSLRRRLAATTILAVSPFLAYGRQAYAACVETPAGSAIYVCSGTSAGETITDDNADVSTIADPPL
jgi:autotransporter family porin